MLFDVDVAGRHVSLIAFFGISSLKNASTPIPIYNYESVMVVINNVIVNKIYVSVTKWLYI